MMFMGSKCVYKEVSGAAGDIWQCGGEIDFGRGNSVGVCTGIALS
jgi:hypothetical protein